MGAVPSGLKSVALLTHRLRGGLIKWRPLCGLKVVTTTVYSARMAYGVPYSWR